MTRFATAARTATAYFMKIQRMLSFYLAFMFAFAPRVYQVRGNKMGQVHCVNALCAVFQLKMQMNAIYDCDKLLMENNGIIDI